MFSVLASALLSSSLSFVPAGSCKGIRLVVRQKAHVQNAFLGCCGVDRDLVFHLCLSEWASAKDLSVTAIRCVSCENSVPPLP